MRKHMGRSRVGPGWHGVACALQVGEAPPVVAQRGRSQRRGWERGVLPCQRSNGIVVYRAAPAPAAAAITAARVATRVAATHTATRAANRAVSVTRA